MRHLLMRRVRASERGFGFRLSTVTFFGVATRVPRFGSCFELSKATNAECFGVFGVFLRISRFGHLKA